MKIFLGSLLISLLLGCSSIPISQQFQHQKQPKPNKQQALVYFFFGPDTGTVPSYPLAVLAGGGYEYGENGAAIAFLKNNTYAWRLLPAGTYIITGMEVNHRGTGYPAKFSFLAGHVYYMEVVVGHGLWSDNIVVNYFSELPPTAIENLSYCPGITCAGKYDTYPYNLRPMPDKTN